MKRTPAQRYVAALVFGLILGWAGCSLMADDSNRASSSDHKLAGTTWKLVSFSVEADGSPGDPIGPYPLAGRYTINFLSDTTLAAQADCNTCGGYYRAESKSTFDTTLACIRAACNRSSEFSAAINTANRYEMTRGRLHIPYTDLVSGEKRILVFERIDEDDE